MSKGRKVRLEGTILASWTRRAIAYADHRGLDGDELLHTVGLERAALQGPESRIAFQQHVLVLERLARALDDPGVGIDIGLTGRPEDFGALGVLAETSPTLRDALDVVRDYNPVANQASVATYWIDGEMAYISDAHLPDGRPTPPLAAEATMAFYAACIALSTGAPAPVQELHLAHGNHGAWTTERAKVFGGVPRFGSPKNALVVPAALLDASLLGSRSSLVPHLRSHAGRLRAALDETQSELHSISAVLREQIHRSEVISLQGLSRALGCSERTLQRRLTGAGVTFRILVDDIRRMWAEELLLAGEGKMDEIARLVGFADERAFRRACVRWFGMPPASVRKGMAPTHLN